VARNYKKKIFFGFAFLAVLTLGAAGALGFYLTRPLDVDFAQDPNTVEAQEADRKLKLLTEAQSARKQGFVRFSEVEINSFLDGKYRSGSSTGGPLELVKAGVLLDEGRFSFVTWHRAQVFGLELPFVWQRVVRPSREADGWSFTLESMRIGALNIPEGHWPRVEKFFGATDTIFEERMAWLKSLPLVTLAHNEESKLPEVRLYTYLPEEKSKGNETASR
jgi:hypothetical protein